MPITYMNTVFVFILGFILLHEKIFVSDLIGAGLIIGFQLYNYYNPPGRAINIEEINLIKNSLINSTNDKDKSNNNIDNIKVQK